MATLKFLLGLLIIAIALGDLFIGLVVVVQLWLNRWRSSLFPYIGNLFLCVMLAVIAIYIANNQLPRNPVPLVPDAMPPRPFAYQIWMLVGLLFVGLGIWPAALKLILVTRKTRPVVVKGGD